MKTQTFEMFTERFVVIATYAFGTGKYGYGETREEAEANAVLPSDFGAVVSKEVWVRANRTKIERRCTYAVYELAA
jgi:hypothetical protein